ncbi:MAG TPA: hypothetical protein PLY31_08585 [Tenuifilaceae bacterium]|jgi:hypothetical protein|nr:hypothetical protein [Tenuifilaceae bacterium]
MVVDVGKNVYAAFYGLLSGSVVYSGKTIPVYTITAGKSAGDTWVTIEQVEQASNSSKNSSGYDVSALLAVTTTTDNYVMLSDVVNDVLSLLYSAEEIEMDGLKAYIVSEPRINEVVEYSDSGVFITKYIRLTLYVK